MKTYNITEEVNQIVVCIEYIPETIKIVESLILQTEGISLQLLKIDYQLGLAEFFCAISYKKFYRQEFEFILTSILQ